MNSFFKIASSLVAITLVAACASPSFEGGGQAVRAHTGDGGAGGGGGADASTLGCKPGDKRACYDGPAGTEGVGACRSGTQFCAGPSWGPCVGQVTPQAKYKCSDYINDCQCIGVPAIEAEECQCGGAFCNGVCSNDLCTPLATPLDCSGMPVTDN